MSRGFTDFGLTQRGPAPFPLADSVRCLEHRVEKGVQKKKKTVDETLRPFISSPRLPVEAWTPALAGGSVSGS